MILPMIAPERHWNWLLRHMKGESIQEIALHDGVSAPCVRMNLTKLGVRFELRREHWRVPVSVMRAYARAKHGAKSRGIRWEFTPETWWAVWEESGKWEQRGRGHGDFQMARYRDSGPYAVWNVRIVEMIDNARENVAVQTHARRARVHQARAA